jgi:ABC-type uncharacterized transport system substrate-binding protein
MEKAKTLVKLNKKSEKARFSLVLGLISLYSGLLISTVTFGHEILILKEATASFQGKILHTIVSQLQASNKKITITSQDIESLTHQQSILTTPDLVITLGSKAAYNQNIQSFPVLHALIPESLYASLADCNKRHCGTKNPVYGLYLDQPITRQLNLLKILLPGYNSPGLLTASFSADKAAEFSIQAKQLNYNFHFGLMENEQQLHHKLNKLLENIDVFIAIPDPLIHNRQTISHLLLTTYRYNVPVLGFSQAYVNAGAVAAIYSSPEQIAQQIVNLIYKILSKQPPQSGKYPNKTFEVAINRNVARSLGLKLPDEQTVKSKLLQLER